MKHILTTIFVLSVFSVNAQLVFDNADNRPGPGFSTDVRYLSAVTVSPGPSGPNVTWDFSGLNTAGTERFDVLKTQTTKFKSSYPNANYVYIIDSNYFYNKVSMSAVERITNSIINPGGSNDYSGNPRTIIEFPFHYLSSFTDTWEGIGDTGAHSVTVTYDAYGTLMLHNGEYKNVARFEEQYATGTDYVWYYEDPFIPLLRYEHTGIVTQLLISPTDLEQLRKNKNTVSVYPNPASDKAKFVLSSGNNGEVALDVYDINGRLMLSKDLNKEETILNTSAYNSGVYFYTVSTEQGVSSGKLIVNH